MRENLQELLFDIKTIYVFLIILIS